MFVLTILLIINLCNVATATDSPFSVSLKLFKPIVISEVKNLAFPDTMLGFSKDLVVSSTDDNSAQFDLVGSSGANIVTAIMENSINLSAPGVSTAVLVDNFTVKAPVALNSSGKGTIGVGGTAHISSDNQDGNYIGLATLRVVYQ